MAKIDHVHLDVSKFILANAIVFWDFDGVIKDSVAIKNNAFVALFDDHGSGLAKRITLHHEANGGMSRFQKIPIYLSWAGLPNDKDSVHQYCYMFSNLVTEAVCDAPWVPGVKEFLLKYNYVRHFVLVSATPQSELELILDKIGIAHCFRWVVGAPTIKEDAIASVLEKHKDIDISSALMIGDSESDFMAAKANHIRFLLRRTKLNHALPFANGVPQFEELL